jgi:signal transduction histidine kinase
VAHGLNSQHLDKYGYVDSVIDFTQRINDTKKLKIDFTFNARKRFSNFLEITLFRITTELINNTLNYARATHVNIVFDHNSGINIITFTYVDNGIGFDSTDIEKKRIRVR